jgi:hypothetical protein
MTGGNGPNNRVTTAEFYQAQLETNEAIAALALSQSKERAAMELRLVEKIGGVPTQVQTNKDEIAILRRRFNIVASIEGLVAGVAIYLGVRNG